MALYTADSIERLREAVDMVGLVGSKTDLRRVGSRWVGLCPFHDERTPSFSVNAELRVYKCFGCERSGDAITFVREAEALDFREAVQLLADRYGVELQLEDEDPDAERRRRRRERLLVLLERTSRFYATYLWDAEEAAAARHYLARRGLGQEVLRAFGVGWAPEAWERVTAAARRDGFTEEELVAAGLAQRGRGGRLHDRFRGRITFPLADARGRVLGFGARALRPDQRPKYLNSAESDVFHKGRQLFGIERARGPAAKAGRVVVAEGYTDVLALHQAGIPESVAIMGTALTPDQLAELARAAGSDGTIYLALDADRSGQEAMLRAAAGARDKQVELRIVDMPEGADPADLITRHGIQAMTERIESAVPVLEFEVERVLADGDLETPGGRDRVLMEVRPLIQAARDRPITRDDLIRRVADRLDVPVEYVTAQAPRGRAVRPTGAAATPRASAAGAGRPRGALAAERSFLLLCLRSGPLGRSYLERLADDHLSSAVARRAHDHLLRHFDDPMDALPEDDAEVASLVTDLAVSASDRGAAAEPVLHMSLLQLEQRRIERAIKKAAEEGNLARQDELAGARQDVRREMDAVMGQTA